MTITGVSTSSTASLSLISGTSYSSDTSAATLMAQGQGIDEASISKGAQQMSSMAKLASSDPDKFKEAAQKISDQLSEKAESSSDTSEASALKEMAAKWADAAETGSMDSLKPSAPPSGQAQSAAMKFKSGQGGDNPMAAMDSVISSVMSEMNISSSSSGTSSGSSVGSYYSTASTSDTAA